MALLQEAVLDSVNRGQTREREMLIELLDTAHGNKNKLEEYRKMALPVRKRSFRIVHKQRWACIPLQKHYHRTDGNSSTFSTNINSTL